MEGDARKGSMIALRHLDGVVGNDCILAAEKDDANIGWIDDDVVLYGLGGTEERDSVRPASSVSIVIGVSTACTVNVIACCVNRYVLNCARRAEKSQGRRAFGLLINYIMDHDAGCP